MSESREPPRRMIDASPGCASAIAVVFALMYAWAGVHNVYDGRPFGRLNAVATLAFAVLAVWIMLRRRNAED